MKNEQSEQVNQILARVYQGRINPLQGVLEVDRAIGGITGVDHRVGTTENLGSYTTSSPKFSDKTIWKKGNLNNQIVYNIRNHRDKISLQRNGLGRQDISRLGEFAALAYWKAQRNGSCFPGEVHIDKGRSTKHYKPSFLVYQNQLLAEYAQTC